MAFVDSTNMLPLWGNPREFGSLMSLRLISLLTEPLERFLPIDL